MNNLQDVIRHTVGTPTVKRSSAPLEMYDTSHIPHMVTLDISKPADVQKYESIFKDILEGKALFQWEERLFASEPLKIVLFYIEVKLEPKKDEILPQTQPDPPKEHTPPKVVALNNPELEMDSTILQPE